MKQWFALNILLCYFWVLTETAMGRRLLLFSYATFKMAAWFQIQTSTAHHLCGHIGFFSFRTLTLVWLWISRSKFQWHITCVYGKDPVIFQQCHFSTHPAAILVLLVSGLYMWHDFQSVTWVCFGISISNVMAMLLVVMARSPWIFRDITFKILARRPYWMFLFPGSSFSLALNNKSKFQMTAWQPYFVFVS